MTDEPFELTRRRVLGGIITVSGASAAAGAGTMAYFHDSESSSNNSVKAGTLNLAIDEGDTKASFFTETDVVPGDAGQETLPVTNNGSIKGYLDVSVSSLTNYENGRVNGESWPQDTGGGDPGEGNGELQNHLEVDAYFLNEETGEEKHLWSTGYEQLGIQFATGTYYDVNYEMPADASRTFVIDWKLPSNTADQAQSDSVELELTFELGQTKKQ